MTVDWDWFETLFVHLFVADIAAEADAVVVVDSNVVVVVAGVIGVGRVGGGNGKGGFSVRIFALELSGSSSKECHQIHIWELFRFKQKIWHMYPSFDGYWIVFPLF